MRSTSSGSFIVVVATVAIVAAAAAVPGMARARAQPRGSFERVAERDGTVLLAAARERGPENTDVQVPRAFVVVANGEERAPPTAVLAGALIADGIAWVTMDGALWIEHADQTLEVVEEAGVISELAVSPSGALAYAKQPGDGAGVYMFARGVSRCVTAGLAFADRPLFIDDARLVVVGAVASGIAGVQIARVDGSGVRAVTNAGLRTGRPFGATFVPPPADHDSMRVERVAHGALALTYFDGRTTQRVAISAGVLR